MIPWSLVTKIVEPRVYSLYLQMLLLFPVKNLFIDKDHTKTEDFEMAEMWLAPPPTFPCATLTKWI